MAATVKEHLLQRSKQVKVGIKSVGGHKNFGTFGLGELSALVGMTGVNWVDLTEVRDGSMAMSTAALQGHQNGYQIHRQTTMELKSAAEQRLREMVNQFDE